MTGPALSDFERKLLHCLLLFDREHGPSATPALKGLDEEAGIERHELEEAVTGLRSKGLVEYWQLQPAVRLTAPGLAIARRLDGGG